LLLEFTFLLGVDAEAHPAAKASIRQRLVVFLTFIDVLL
jgi:hypothetical protein